MLQLARAHLRDNGLLFLVLPLACVENSRYLTRETFDDLLRAVGFELVKFQGRTAGKLAYWLYQRQPSEKVPQVDPRWQRKNIVIDGGRRNNFAIRLP